MQYHWYDSNGRWYTDFIESSHLPDLVFVSFSPALLAVGQGAYIRDQYGNEYYSGGIGGGIVVSVAEHWEGYVSRNTGNSPRSWNLLSENELKKVILGPSVTLDASITTAGAGVTIWRPGIIALFGDYNYSLGGSLALSFTWQAPQKDFLHAWNWVHDIPRYSPP